MKKHTTILIGKQNALAALLTLTIGCALPAISPAQQPAPPPQGPQAFGGGNQHGGTVGVQGVPLAPGVTGSASMNFSTQPRLQPQAGGAGVTIQHDWFGR